MGLVRRALTLWAFCSVGAIASAPIASAQDDTTRARALFEGAVAAIDEGRFADAVVDLRESLSLSPRAPTAFNLGIALRGVGKAIESRDVFDRLLAGELGELPAARRAQVQALRDEVAAEVGRVRVRVDGPAGATVTADGLELEREADGTFVAELDPGRHAIRATAVDHDPGLSDIELAPGEERTLTLTLRAAIDEREGVLILDCEHPDATVEIVDVASGPPPLSRSLAPGPYRARVHVGDDMRESTVELPAGRRVRLLLEPPTSDVIENPWLWIGLGAGVAALAGILIWGLTQLEMAPIEDPFWGSIGLVD